MKTLQPSERYFDEALGVFVNVYEEKKVKRRAWMRGEAFLSQKMRIGDENDRMFARFTRKNGKY
jgi:hypothetical protein